MDERMIDVWVALRKGTRKCCAEEMADAAPVPNAPSAVEENIVGFAINVPPQRESMRMSAADCQDRRSRRGEYMPEYKDVRRGGARSNSIGAEVETEEVLV